MSFIKKKALVTGGVGGIGHGITHALTKKGCKVIIFDIAENGFEIVEKMNVGFDEELVFYFQVDLKDEALLMSKVRSVVDHHGAIDFLINNAGIDTIGPIEEVSDAEYHDTLQINADAAFLLCRELVPCMKNLGGGSIVNIMSIILSGGWDDRVPYAMSKGSLLGLTRALAREVGKYNIRVNAVSPGAIPTAMERKFWKDDRSELDRIILEHQALKYRGSVEDVANAVLFLLSDQSQFITGHELHVNGGWYMG